MLCSHLAADGKRSVRALETEAISLYDRGITDFQGLIEYLDLREKSSALEARVRKLFGIGKRTLTPKEQAFVEAWTKSALPFDIVEHAYEVTVNATGEASMPYANSVLESWINSGFSTLDEIKKSEEKSIRKAQSRRAKSSRKALRNPHLRPTISLRLLCAVPTETPNLIPAATASEIPR